MLTTSARTRRAFNEGQPRIVFSKLPPEEQRRAFDLQSAMYSAASYIQHFDDAVALFEYCGLQIDAALRDKKTSQGPEAIHRFKHATGYAFGWRHIAARDAPINLWNFARMLAEIRSIANECPTIKSLSDWTEVEGSLKEFHVTFPTAWQSRVGAAHAADIGSKPEQNSITGNFETSGLKIQGSNVLVTDTIAGNKAVSTVDGQAVECELSSSTVAIMHRILQRLYAAFRGAAR